jgi:hypothetical protein
MKIQVRMIKQLGNRVTGAQKNIDVSSWTSTSDYRRTNNARYNPATTRPIIHIEQMLCADLLSAAQEMNISVLRVLSPRLFSLVPNDDRTVHECAGGL